MKGPPVGVNGAVVVVVEVTEPVDTVAAAGDVDEGPVEFVGMLPASGVYLVVS
jgi:hypothetical protein